MQAGLTRRNAFHLTRMRCPTTDIRSQWMLRHRLPSPRPECVTATLLPLSSRQASNCRFFFLAGIGREGLVEERKVSRKILREGISTLGCAACWLRYPMGRSKKGQYNRRQQGMRTQRRNLLKHAVQKRRCGGKWQRKCGSWKPAP